MFFFFSYALGQTSQLYLHFSFYLFNRLDIDQNKLSDAFYSKMMREITFK